MMKDVLTAALAVACFTLAAPESGLARHCESIQAKCAIEIGGACDPVASHWMYGPRYNLGGDRVSFNACLARHGIAPPVAAPSAMSRSGSKCTTDQARCAVEVGGFCNPRTGGWCVGGANRGNVNCGGKVQSFLVCLDRIRAGRK